MANQAAAALFPDPDTRYVLDPGCGRCPELVESRERIAWGNGTPDAEVFVVGEAPGIGTPDADRWRGGNWTGLAYTARRSGRLIRQLFFELGYGPEDLYVTNAVKCFPADPDEPSTNREPTAIERRTCRAHLETELDQVDPAVVVTTGRHATASVFELGDRTLDGFLELVLEPQSVRAVEATVLPLLHPSYENVWRARLGYEDRDEYVTAVGEVLTTVS